MNLLIDYSDPEILTLADKPKVPQSTALPWYATESQRAALTRLNARADLFVRMGDSSASSFRPLLRCLLIGGTGTGKSTLAREFARQRAWSFITVDCGSWLPQGALAKPPALRLVRDFIRSTKEGFCCVYLDELCKAFPKDSDSGWYYSIYSEILALCDADDRLKGHEWTSADIFGLRERCYLICGGAFTRSMKAARAAQKRGALGFSDSRPTETHSSKIREVLPEEIFNRFGEHLVLEAPSRQDYARGIELIHSDLGVERATPIKELLDLAEASENGVRWLTDYLTQVLLKNPNAAPRRKPVAKTLPTTGYDFAFADTQHFCRLITRDSHNLRGTLARLYAEYGRCRAAIAQGEKKAFTKYIFGNTDRMEGKLLDALKAANACWNITTDDAEIFKPLMAWREYSWEGIRAYPSELAEHGMLSLWTKTWDLVSRVAELRAMLHSYVAAGRYSGGMAS